GGGGGHRRGSRPGGSGGAVLSRVGGRHPRAPPGRAPAPPQHTAGRRATPPRWAAPRPELPLPAALAPEVAGATVVEGPGASDVLAASDLVVTSMGRGPPGDPAFFAAATSAGAWVAEALAELDQPRTPGR